MVPVTAKLRVKRVWVQSVAVYTSAQEHEQNVSEKYNMQPIRIMRIADKGAIVLLHVMGGRKSMSKQSFLNVYDSLLHLNIYLFLYKTFKRQDDSLVF